MTWPDDANGDVFRRMANSGFDFTKEHSVEFFAVFATEHEAAEVAQSYVQDHKNGDRLDNVETKPYDEGGMELTIAKTMLVTYENVTQFEKRLQDRVTKKEGYLDGWGVLQE